MKAADLRKSILQAAVQGKLVPQNPHDEPATKLLERIRKEKAQLVKEGKIKRIKPLPPVSEEEIPFDLPEGWVWCRLGEIIHIINGDRGKNYPSKDKLSSTGIPFVSALNIHNYTISKSKLLRLNQEQYDALGSGKLILNDIIFCIRGSLGKFGLYPFACGAIASSLVIIRRYYDDNVFLRYMMLYLDSPIVFREIKKYDNGTAQPNLAAGDLSYFLFPLPPSAEQDRIAAKAIELMSLCDELEAAEKELDTLESQFSEYLPKSILQAAVQGKLVPQNIHDEPADKLLERIRAEKAKLIKSGKLKKEKPLPSITEEEIPYDLPDGWTWCRLGEICRKIGSGSTPRGGRDVYVSSGIPFLRSQNIRNEGVTLAGAAYITEQIHTKMYNTTVRPCDILLNITGASLGRCALVPDKFPTANVSQHVTIIRLCDNEIRNFIHKLFIAPQYQQLIWERQVGMAREGLSKKTLELFEVPLPPLAEQQRIVAKVNELMTLCDALKAAHDTPVGAPIAATVIPFPHQEEEPEMLMAARGAMPKAPSKALQDARNRLFED